LHPVGGPLAPALLFIVLINAGVELPTAAGLRPTCAHMAKPLHLHLYLHRL
jgi:hypothetical protein